MDPWSLGEEDRWGTSDQLDPRLVGHEAGRGGLATTSSGMHLEHGTRSSSNPHALALARERKGHGSSLALAALELAEKETQLATSPRPPIEGGRLLKMASFGKEESEALRAEAAVCTTSCDPTSHKTLQIQGFVQDRKMSSSPLEANDIDIAIRPGRILSETSACTPTPCVTEVTVRRHFAGHPTMIFVGVMEGHGPYGRKLAVDLGQFLPNTLEEEMLELGLQRCSDDVIKLALVHACEAGHARLLEANGASASSGVQAMIGLVAHDKAYIANVGKGRCVLVSERMLGQSVEFERVGSDVEATPSTPGELERIVRSGGVVGRFEDSKGIPFGSLRVFREGSLTCPGVTSSRALGNKEALACGVLPEPIVTECSLNSRNSFFIWGSEGTWNAIGDEDASRVVSQYAKRRIVDHGGLTSADVLSFYAQRQSREKNAGNHESISDVAVVVVDLRDHIVPGESPRMSEEDILALQAASTNEEAIARTDHHGNEHDLPSMDTMQAAFARVETLCELHKTKEIEFCDRTSSLTQMMRGDSGDIALGSEKTTVAGSASLATAGMERVVSCRHGGLPLMPSSSFERITEDVCVRISSDHEGNRGLASGFVPSQAIGVPVSAGRRKPKAKSLKAQTSIENELRPIRKVEIPVSNSLTHIKSSDSLDESGVFSQRSQSLGMHEVWSFSDRDTFSPRSSEGLGRANSLLLEHSVGMYHEGKVRRGIPASLKSFTNLRLSSDSESEPRSWSRPNSLEEDVVLGFDGTNSPLRNINRVPSGSFGSGRGSSLLASSSHRSLRRQWSSSMSNLKSLAEDGDVKQQISRSTSNTVRVVKDIHKFFN